MTSLERPRPVGTGARLAAAWAAVLAALTVAACGSSTESVVRGGTGRASSPQSAATSAARPRSVPPSSAPASSAPAGSSSRGSATPAVQVVPASGLREGQSVLVRGTGFSPGQQYTVIECAQKGAKTGPGDCNLGGLQTVSSDASGVVQTRLRVVKGPFGANKIVCSTEQHCLVSVTQASLSPTEEADRRISFGA